MLRILVPGDEFYDEDLEEFVTRNDVILDLEHSLATLSKWESVFERPFLSAEEKTSEEVFEYIKMMTLTPEFPPEVFSRLTEQNLEDVNEYINSKQSATTFYEQPSNKKPEIITSELIYYWIFSLQIPLECEHWHLNRLFTLIRVFNVKNAPEKKMSASEIAARNRELNAQRRAQYNTRG